MTLEDGALGGSGSRRHGGDELQVQPLGESGSHYHGDGAPGPSPRPWMWSSRSKPSAMDMVDLGLGATA